MRMSLSDIGSITHALGDFEDYADLYPSRIQTDSRLVQSGDLFVCIPGNRFDGHNFAQEAVKKGAIALIIERPLLETDLKVPFLLVPDSVKALGLLAAEWRNRFNGWVIAITGTAGKTTVKEFLASILELEGKVNKNFKNWNNQLGVSLSILGFSGKEKYWILEAGISIQGDMDVLGSILTPNLAIIINVGSAHLEGLGDCYGVAKEKAKLLSYLKPQGKTIISSDYPILQEYLPNRDDIQIKTFSSYDAKSDTYGSYLGCFSDEFVFDLCLQGEKYQVSSKYGGLFLTENILAAALTASILGLEKNLIQKGLVQANIPEHRCKVHNIGGIKIIDDCYNANPFSIRLVLKSIANETENNLILLLGDMKELGEIALGEHQDLGKFIAALNCDQIHLMYYGKYHQEVQTGFLQGRPTGTFIRICSVDEFKKSWRDLNLQKATVLIKGSRGCQMENFVNALLGELRR